MQPHQQTLEDLEMEFKREATELARARDQEEDEENYKHREVKVYFVTMNATLFRYLYFTT